MACRSCPALALLPGEVECPAPWCLGSFGASCGSLAGTGVGDCELV